MYAPAAVNRRQNEGQTGRRRVRKVKNAQGTRVSRAVTCSSCGAEDRVDFVPREGQAVLCRACAAQELGVEDREAGLVPEETRQCPACNRAMTVPLETPEDFVCADCHHGIFVPDRARMTRAEPTGQRGTIRIRRDPTKR